MRARRVAPSFAIAAVLALAAGCDNSKSPPPSGDGGTAPTGWRAAVGAGGLFAQTFDDPAWTARQVTSGALYSVACVGDSAGWVSGANGFVAHTLDGGATWSTQDTHVHAALYSVRFGTLANGVVAGEAGTLAVTHDGGATWALVPALTTATLRGVTAAGDGQLMLAVGDLGTVLRSTDAGATWSTSTLADAGDLRAIALTPDAHLALAVDTRGAIWSSADGGRTFAREATAPASLESISTSDDGELALAAGAGGTALVRSAGTWSTVALPARADLHAALVADHELYVGGDDGTLLGSEDSGGHWDVRALGTRAAIYGLDDL